MQTGWRAFRLGIVAYIIPFMFVFQPALLLSGSFAYVAQAVATSVIGVIALAGGMQGYFLARCFPHERVMLIGAGITLLYPGLVTDIIGIGLVVLTGLFQVARRRRAANQLEVQRI